MNSEDVDTMTHLETALLAVARTWASSPDDTLLREAVINLGQALDGVENMIATRSLQRG